MEGSLAEPEQGGSRTIVVGVAEPEISQAPLRWAVEQARAFGKTLLAVSVYPPGPLEPWPSTPRPEDAEDQAAARAKLDDAIARLGEAHRGVEIRRETIQGRPVKALVDASRSAALLVLGGRKARGRLDLRPSSVAVHVVQLAACPVVVVPPHPRSSARHRQGDVRP